MNFDFSDDQKLLKEQARKFLTDKCPTKVVRRVLDGNETYADEVWKGIVELGVTGDRRFPKQYGGLGLVAARALRRRRGARPRGGAGAVRLVGRAGDRGDRSSPAREAQKKKWLPAARRRQGDRHASRIAEGPQPPKPRSIRTTFGGGRLNGKKLPVADGDVADLRRRAGQHRRAGRSRRVAGAGRPQAGGRDARSASRPSIPRASTPSSPSTAPPAELLGAEGEGWRTARSGSRSRRGLFAFEQVGGAEAALEMARDYALQRYAFGRADRLVPGDQAQARRHVRQDRAGALQRLLRRLGADRRRRRAAGGGRGGAHHRHRGLLLRRRRRTSRPTAASASPGRSTASSTIAARKLLALVARRACTGLEGPARSRRLESSEERAPRPEDAERKPWTSTTPPKKPQFRKEVRAWLEANADAQERRQAALHRAAPRRARARSRRQGVAGQEGRRRLRAHHLAQGVRRPRRLADPCR